MFPRLREQIGTALDLIVEFSTLGEYRLEAESFGASSAPADAPGQAPQLGGVGARAPRAAVRRTVAGGATGVVPVATPAARRRLRGAAHRSGDLRGSDLRGSAIAPAHARTRVRQAPRVRHGAPKAPEQLCFAV